MRHQSLTLVKKLITEIIEATRSPEDRHLYSSAEEIFKIVNEIGFERPKAVTNLLTTLEISIAPRGNAETIVLGSGAYGTVIDAIWRGKRVAVKIANGGKEAQSYQRIADIRSSLGPSGEIFPEIFLTQVIDNLSVIVLEQLVPLDAGTLSVLYLGLRYLSSIKPVDNVKITSQKLERISSQVDELMQDMIDEFLINLVDPKGRNRSKIESLVNAWRSRSKEGIRYYLNSIKNYDSLLWSHLVTKIQNILKNNWSIASQIQPPSKGNKNVNYDNQFSRVWSAVAGDGLKNLSTFHDRRDAEFPDTINSKRVQSPTFKKYADPQMTTNPAVRKLAERLITIFTENPELNLELSDLHSGNFMKRARTGDLVIVDLGEGGIKI